MKTAILVDGGYYRKLAKHYAGEKLHSKELPNSNHIAASICGTAMFSRLTKKSRDIISIPIYTEFFITTANLSRRRFIIRF